VQYTCRRGNHDCLWRWFVVDDDGPEGDQNPKTGEWQVVWIINPQLSKEQQRALIERPDTTQ
jgi:hypothetical protein